MRGLMILSIKKKSIGAALNKKLIELATPKQKIKRLGAKNKISSDEEEDFVFWKTKKKKK